MTIKELYEWAVENGAENLPYVCDYGEGIEQPDEPEVDEKNNRVVLQKEGGGFPPPKEKNKKVLDKSRKQ